MSSSLSSWFVAALLVCGVASAAAHDGKPDCGSGETPLLSFVQFASLSVATSPPSLLTVKGKLSLPQQGEHHLGCTRVNGRKLPAVVILHGSSGVDARGDFYEAALNAAGIATLQIDMWEARGVGGAVSRPAAPIFTLPDAYSALAFLAARPEIDAARIGVLGFSWGGVNSLATAERLYTSMFGNGRQFKAHVAHYPVCYAANAVIPGMPTPAQLGTQFLNLTGAPVLVQVGGLDGYDNGVERCRSLAQAVNGVNADVVQVVGYPGAQHAFDRLMVPIVVSDPFGNEGSYFRSGVVPRVTLAPDVDQAYQARDRAVRFLRKAL
ncbi:MAG: dienelactone hydrolase family protein [Burkholderiaceae bacterium]